MREYHDDSLEQMPLFPVFVLVVNMLLSVWDNRAYGHVNHCLLQLSILSLLCTTPWWLKSLPSESDLGEKSLTSAY